MPHALVPERMVSQSASLPCQSDTHMATDLEACTCMPRHTIEYGLTLSTSSCKPALSPFATYNCTSTSAPSFTFTSCRSCLARGRKRWRYRLESERERARVHATEREGREGPNRAMRQHAKEKQTMPLTATGKHGSAFIHVLCTFHVLHAIGVEN